MDSGGYDRSDEVAGGGDLGRDGYQGAPDRGHRLGRDEELSHGDRLNQDERLRWDSSPGRAGHLSEGDKGGSRGRRQDGMRRVRHMSNWTAAALLAGTGVATVALATHATQTGTTAAASGSSTQGTSVQAGAPHVKGSVVTSGGSGATVTTTKKVVNGKVVVTKVRHAAAWHDN